ncbi:uncharacterized protein [Watersipora subatra]
MVYLPSPSALVTILCGYCLFAIIAIAVSDFLSQLIKDVVIAVLISVPAICVLLFYDIYGARSLVNLPVRDAVVSFPATRVTRKQVRRIVSHKRRVLLFGPIAKGRSLEFRQLSDVLAANQYKTGFTSEDQQLLKDIMAITDHQSTDRRKEVLSTEMLLKSKPILPLYLDKENLKCSEAMAEQREQGHTQV